VRDKPVIAAELFNGKMAGSVTKEGPGGKWRLLHTEPFEHRAKGPKEDRRRLKFTSHLVKVETKGSERYALGEPHTSEKTERAVSA